MLGLKLKRIFFEGDKIHCFKLKGWLRGMTINLLEIITERIIIG
jgi:hypothetical protein